MKRNKNNKKLATQFLLRSFLLFIIMLAMNFLRLLLWRFFFHLLNAKYYSCFFMFVLWILELLMKKVLRSVWKVLRIIWNIIRTVKLFLKADLLSYKKLHKFSLLVWFFLIFYMYTGSSHNLFDFTLTVKVIYFGRSKI